MSVMQKNNFSVKEWLCQHKFVAGTAIAARCSAVDLPLRRTRGESFTACACAIKFSRRLRVICAQSLPSQRPPVGLLLLQQCSVVAK